MGGILSTTRPLTIADAHSLRNLPGVTGVLPVVQGTGEISTGPRNRASEIIGVGTGMPDAWNFREAQGPSCRMTTTASVRRAGPGR